MAKARLGIAFRRQELLLMALRPGSGAEPATARLALDWADLAREEAAAALAQGLAGLAGRLEAQVGQSLDQALVILPNNQVLCHRLWPARGRRAGADDLQAELEEASPFDPVDLYCDYQLLAGGRGEWEAAAARREVVDQVAGLVRAAGMEVAGLDGQARYLTAALPKLLPAKEPTVYFHLTPDEALLVQAQGGEPLDWRLVRALAGEGPEALARRAAQGLAEGDMPRGESRAVFLGPAGQAAAAQDEGWSEVVVAAEQELLPAGLGWEWLPLFAGLAMRRPSPPLGNLLPGRRDLPWLERPAATAFLAVLILLVLAAWGGAEVWRGMAKEDALAQRVQALKEQARATHRQREELLAARKPVELAEEKNQAALAALGRAGQLELPQGVWLEELIFDRAALVARVASQEPADLTKVAGLAKGAKPKLISAKGDKPLVWELVLQGEPKEGQLAPYSRRASAAPPSAPASSFRPASSGGLPSPGAAGKPSPAVTKAPPPDRGPLAGLVEEPPPSKRRRAAPVPSPANRPAPAPAGRRIPEGWPEDLPPPGPGRVPPAPPAVDRGGPEGLPPGVR